MTTTVYSNGTLIVPAWLNDVDAATYVKLANVTTISAAAGTVLDDASVGAMRTTLGAAASGVNTDITSLNSPAIAAATATTQAAATSNTTVATTAFVQQEVPAASTTVAGKSELATTAEVQTGTDTARVPSVASMQAGKIVLSSLTAAASQTSIDSPTIPSWAKRVKVHFNGLSTNGSSIVQIQLIDGGGVETNSYLGSASDVTASSGTALHATGFLTGSSGSASYVRNGTIELYLVDSATFLWSCGGNLGYSDAARVSVSNGVKATSAIMTQVRVTTVIGSETFDAGSVSFSYE